MIPSGSIVKRLGKKGVPFIATLASPTSNHLLATAVSNADIIFIEPRALVGFAPRKVAQPRHDDRSETLCREEPPLETAIMGSGR